MLSYGIQLSIPIILKNYQEKIIEVAEVSKWQWLDESGQWLENVD